MIGDDEAPGIAKLARRGISQRPEGFPVESPEERRERAQHSLAILKSEQTPDPEATELESEIARVSKIAGGVATDLKMVEAQKPAAPPTWDEVVKLPEMQKLTADDLEAARGQYFVDVVAPHVPTEQLGAAREAFDADTKPGRLSRAMRALEDTVTTVRTRGVTSAARDVVSLSGETLDQLERSYRGLKQGVFAHGLTFNRKQLDLVDRIDRGEAVPEADDAGGYAHMDAEGRKRYRAALEGGYKESLGTIVKEAREIAGLYHNPAAQESIKAANEKRWKDAWEAFKSDPVGIVKDLTVSNAAQVVPMAAGGIAGAALKGVPGMMVGFASGSFPVDYAMSVVGYLSEQGVDLSDYKAVDAKLREPGFLEELQRYATMHAGGVAALDAVTGRVMSPVRGGAARATAAAAGNVGKAVAGEMAGEATGQVLATGDLKAGDVIAEGLAAGPMAVGGSVAATVARPKDAPGGGDRAPEGGQDAARAAAPRPGGTPALPAPVIAAGDRLAPDFEAQQRADQAKAAADQVYEEREAEEQRLAEALAAQELAKRPEPEIQLADPKAIFDAAKGEPSILKTIGSAMRALPEYKEATPAVQFDLDAAVSAIEADPKAIFRLAAAKPEIYGTIARVAEQTQKLERKPTKGAPNAGGIRGNEGQVHQAGAVAEGSEGQGGEDLQREAGSGAAGGDVEVRRAETGEQGNQVDAAAHEAATSPANDRSEPTEAQKEAGNYAKGHPRVAGMEISIENPEGSQRRPEWPVLADHYGYIRGTVGFDKDHLDVFVKPGTAEDFSGTVYVINQTKENGRFDEHKAMLGFDSEAAARAAYQANYTKGWDRGKSIVALPLEQFKAWAFDKTKSGPKGGELKQPKLAPQDARALLAARRFKKLPQVVERLQYAIQRLEGEVADLEKRAKTRGIGKPHLQMRNDARAMLEQKRKALEENRVELARAQEMIATGRPPEIQNWEVEYAAEDLPERRADTERRKKVADMAPEEMRRALLTDPLTGLGNRRAYEESEKLPVQVALDLDGLKWVNDNMGHAAGDAFIKSVGEALAEDPNAYHLSGDEFALQAQSDEDARAAVQAVQDRLAQAELTFRLADGSEVTKKGVDFSHGIGSTLEEADAALRSHKDERQAAGERPGRGEAPPGVTRRPAEGSEAGRDQAAGQEALAPPRGDAASLARSRGAGAAAMAIADVQKEADRLTNGWKNAPGVVVLADPSDAPFDAPDDAMGAYWRGKMYLFAFNLQSPEQIQVAVFHEVLGHHGLRKFFGKDLDPVLQDIAMRNGNVRAAAEAWKKSNEKPAGWTDADYNLQAIEEALAELAGTGAELQGLGRLMAAIQQWLRIHGFDSVADWLESLTDAEARSVLARARSFVVDGDAPHVFAPGLEAEPAFARPPDFTQRLGELLLGKGQRDIPLVLSDTPAVLTAMGLKPHQVWMTTDVAEKIFFDHGVPKGVMERLPQLLADPVMVFESDTVPDTYVVVTTEVVKGLPLVVAVKPETAIQREVVNLIASAYPRKKPKEALARWIQDGLLRYVHTAKRPEWQRSTGLQLPKEMPLRGAGRRVLTQSDVVKASGGQAPDTKEAPAFSRGQAKQLKKRTYSAIANAIIDRIDRALDPVLGLPDRDFYLKMRYLAQGEISRLNDVGRGIFDVFGKADEADTKAAYEYFTTKGAAPDRIKDAAIRDHAVKTKAMIDGVGQELVKRNLLAEETFEANRGAYLPRLYLKHLLNAQDFARVGSGRKPSDLGYLKKRQDIPAEIREVMLGEIKDPGYLASVAFTRAMRDVALLDWLSRISKNEQWVLPKSLVEHNGHKVTPYWLKSEATRLRAQAEFMEEGAAAKAKAAAAEMDKAAAAALQGLEIDEKQWKAIPDAPRYGRLRGLVVRREIHDDIVGIGAVVPADANAWEKLFGYGGWGTKATQLWKASKVSMNPPSQVRNFVSNAVLLHLSGVAMVKVPLRIAQAAHAIATNGEAWRLAKRGGVKTSTFAAQELYRIEREMLALNARESARESGTWTMAQVINVAAKLFNAAGDLYQFMEALFKTAKIIDELQRGHSAANAVLEANKWLFDYSRVRPIVRYMRNAPIGAPFITFQVKVAPRLVEVALKHPHRFLPYLLLAWGLPMVIASMIGADKDDVDKLKKLLPESWQTKGHVYVLPWKDDHGRWQILDLSYFFPWAQFDQMARQASRGDALGVIKSLGVLGGPFPDIMIASKTNKDPFTGRDIVPDGAPLDLQLGAMLTYAMDMVLPPWLTSKGFVGLDFGDPTGVMSGKVVRAIEGKTSKTGDPVTTGTQAALSLAGVNLRSVDPKADRNRILEHARRGIGDVQTELKRTMEDRALPPEQREIVRKRYLEEIDRRKAAQRKLADDTKLPPRLQ